MNADVYKRQPNKYADSKRGTKRSVSIGGEQNMNEKHELEKYLNMLTEGGADPAISQRL